MLPVYRSPPSLSIHGILQARILEWGALLAVSYVEHLKSPGVSNVAKTEMKILNMV